MQAYEALSDTMETEIRSLTKLIALARQKHAVISDEKQIAMIAAKEEKILQRLQHVEAERQALFDVVAPGKSLQQWLDEAGEIQVQLAPVAERLQQSFVELKDLNEINMQLVEESLAYVRYSLNLLNASGPSTYGRKGQTDAGRSIFNRKV